MRDRADDRCKNTRALLWFAAVTSYLVVFPAAALRGSSRYNGYRVHHVSLEVNAVHSSRVPDVRLAFVFRSRSNARGRRQTLCWLLITFCFTEHMARFYFCKIYMWIYVYSINLQFYIWLHNDKKCWLQKVGARNRYNCKNTRNIIFNKFSDYNIAAWIWLSKRDLYLSLWLLEELFELCV